MQEIPEITINLVSPIASDGRSPVASSNGFPLTDRQADEQNTRALADAVAQIQLRASVEWLMAKETERQRRIRRVSKPVAQVLIDAIMTKREVAAYCHVTVRTVEMWVKEGLLRRSGIRRRGRSLFRREEVERLLAAEPTPDQNAESFDQFITTKIGD